MSKVEKLEKQIESLSSSERAQLRDWFHEHDWEKWDRQIERDAGAGKLDALFAKSTADHRRGKSKEI